LGRRHVTYGVQEAHYELVIKALLETFQEVLGSNFTGPVQELWREALDFVAQVMIRGARKTQLRRANMGGP
jgi:hemoglobin-like flavoprotein